MLWFILYYCIMAYYKADFLKISDIKKSCFSWFIAILLPCVFNYKLLIPCGKWVRWVGNMLSCSNIFWCDLPFFTIDGKSAVHQSRACINLYDFVCKTYFWWLHCVSKVLKHYNTPLSLSWLVYSAGLHLQGKRMLLHQMYKDCVQ